MKIEAQSHSVPFYEGYGFATVGEPFNVEGIDHVEMQLELD